MKFTGVFLLALAVAVSPLTAASSPTSGNAWLEAVKDFSAHVQLGQYKEALAAFERAKEAGRSPKVGSEFGIPQHQLPSLVLVYERTGHPDKALATLKVIRALPTDSAPRYLDFVFSRIEPKMSDPAVKAEVKKLIAEKAGQRPKR